LDDELSRRPLQLDDAGYFIISIDRNSSEIVAIFYTNTINNDGAASSQFRAVVSLTLQGFT
jgi:hypothetical protein